MENTRRYYKSRKSKNPLLRFFQNIGNLFRGAERKKEPVEYRPFLGKDQSSFQTERPDSEEEGRLHRKRKKRWSPFQKFREYTKNRDRRLEERRKRKFKRKVQRKHKREYKRRARIDFIRKFLPNYKLPKNVPLTELTEEEAAEAIKSQQKNYFYYTINSIALFITAYLLIYMIYQLTVLVTASRWRLDSVLYYFDLAFNDYSPLWSRLNIIIVTASGPVVCLLIGILFFRLISNRKKLKGFRKLLVMWIAIIGFNMFLGAFASGVSFDEGFGYVPAWLYLNVFWQIFISLLFLFILGLIGYYSASKFLDTSNSSYRVRPENKVKFLFFQVVLPWIIGILIIFLVKIPNNTPYDTANLITLGFGVVPVLFNRYARPTVLFESERKPTRINWYYIILFMVLLLAFRIGLNNGLHVVLNYKFIFSLEVTPV
ncbi:MAG: hypothetical protein JW731_05685 [Bacteroidales bacterium]|nr:hypothetical protein [Bacteroidales bacterium]